jgi:tripartite-type tricarboxylate transporter receptor subunit TctC
MPAVGIVRSESYVETFRGREAAEWWTRQAVVEDERSIDLMTKCIKHAVTIAFLLALGPALAGEGYPAKPIRMIDPFAPGGSTEAQARSIAMKLTEAWGQPVVIESRPGAGSALGTQIVANATADGYTVLFTNPGFVTVPSMARKPPFDPIRDFVPVIRVGTQPQLLVVHHSLPGTLKEFLNQAKANPGKLNYGSTGVGGGSHLGIEYLKSVAGIDLVHVAYKGSAPATTALLAGEVQLVSLTANSVLPHIRAGRLRALAVTSPNRSIVVPEVPSVREAGLAGFEVVSWTGIFAPAKTPSAIVDQLNRQINLALKSKEVRERFTQIGIEPSGGTPADLAAFVAGELRKWAKVIDTARIERN